MKKYFLTASAISLSGKSNGKKGFTLSEAYEIHDMFRKQGGLTLSHAHAFNQVFGRGEPNPVKENAKKSQMPLNEVLVDRIAIAELQRPQITQNSIAVAGINNGQDRITTDCAAIN